MLRLSFGRLGQQVSPGSGSLLDLQLDALKSGQVDAMDEQELDDCKSPAASST
jgi:hypothetical protein